jgi:hypothetical protein
VPSGSIFTNDDIFDVTGAVGSTAGSDYAVLQFFVLPPTASENGGDILANGRFLIVNDDNSTFQLFDGQMALLATVAGLTSSTTSIVRTCLTPQVFYAAKTPLNGHISRVDGNGAVTASWVLPGTSLTCLGASNDETIIYVGGNGGSVNTAIKQFNPATSLFGADLAPGLANYTTVDLLVMGDGNVVVIYTYTNSTQPTIIKRYSAAGATLNTYTIGIPTGDRTEVSLFHALDDPTSFWTRVHDMVADATCTFYNIRASDGTILTTITQATYTDGALEIAVPTATPSARFGLAGSCPSFILREAIGPPTPPAPNGDSGTEYLIRRERWFPHIGQEQLRQFFSKLQIDLYAGNGISTGQGSDPLLEIDWSDDGGHTWSDIHFVQTGAIGAFRTRAILRRMGSSRDRVFRIACSDPVQWSIVNGYLDATLGTS